MLLVVIFAAPLVVAARQPDSAGTPAVPSGSPSRPRCPVRAVSPTTLVAVLREPVPEDPAADDPRGDPLPPGERVTIGELVATWSQCLASGDVPALLGLFTPDGISRLLGERSPYVGGPAGLEVSILAVSDVVRLPDDRVAARVVVDPSGSGAAAPESLTVVIEQDQNDPGLWRIDHLRSPQGPVGAAGPIDLDPEAPPRALLRHPIAPGPSVRIPAPGPTVPMRGADVARTGNQAGPAPAAPPAELWRAPTGWHSEAQPVAARGLIYFGGFSLGERTPLLEAVDAASGGVRWQTTAPVAWAEFPDSPALGGDILYAPVQAPIAGVLAVVAGTGEPLWFAPFGFTSVTAPAVDADAVYVAGWGVRNARDRVQNDASGAVFALDQRTGRERWRFLAPARFGPLAVGRDAIYVPSDRGLFAIDRASGSKRWQARFAPDAGQAPVVAADIVVFAGAEITSGKTGVFALDAATGALLWRVDLPAVAGARSGAAAGNGTVFVTWWDAPTDQPDAGMPTLRAYDLESGTERWVYRATEDASVPRPAGAGSVTAPVLVDNVVLFGVAIRVPAEGAGDAVDGLHAVDTATGALRWRGPATAPIRSAPAVLDGRIYAMGGLRPRGDASGGNLIAFGAE
jgi:outer membrane protein assembly factor BamB